LKTPSQDTERIDIVDKQDAYRPAVSFLSETGRHRIHQGALQVLHQTGMKVLHEEALTLLSGAGCSIDKGNIVRIPQGLVEGAIKSAPRAIEIYDRDDRVAMHLGGHRVYFGTGSDLLYIIDPESRQRRRCVLEDVRRAARLCDGLSNIDFVMSFSHPSDVVSHRAFLCSFQAMVENTRKSMVCTAEGRDDLREMWEIAKVIRNGEEHLRSKPYFIHYAEPISPLKQAFSGLDKLLFCAEKGIPVIYSPAPISGSTAPLTVAGHVAQGLAECLCGVVIHQLKHKGAPVIRGMGPAVLDMATGECSYNAPEYYLAYMAAVEMSHVYDLPSWGYAGTSDSQIPDGQATLEAGLMTFLAAMAGANLNHDVGYLDFGRTGSLEMVVIMDETIDQIRRMLRGIPTDDDSLALDVIDTVGPGGHFLTEAHTSKHVRTTQWRPTLFSRWGHDAWKDAGENSLKERARERVLAILRDHKTQPLPPDKAREIRDRVDRFRPSGG